MGERRDEAPARGVDVDRDVHGGVGLEEKEGKRRSKKESVADTVFVHMDG